MSNNKKYWKNLAELNSANNDVFDDLQNKEFVQEIPVDEFLSDKDNLANSSTSVSYTHLTLPTIDPV